jgi:hypothetical protein
MARPGALARVNDQDILDRISAGEHASAVAASLGVHKAAITHRYKANPEYAEAREAGTEIRLNELEARIAELSKPLPQPELPDEPTEIETRRYKVALKAWQMSHAEREFNLACARELYKAASWRASVEFPHRWGQRNHVTIEHVGDLADKLRRARERVIEHEPVVDTPNGAVHTGLLTDSAAPEQ